MKKTLTINLNNSVFHIDDDAYELLQSYLGEVVLHLQNERDKDDIMFDIEARIAEIFDEKMDKNKNVVTFSDVENVICVMGKPSQFTEEDDDTYNEEDENTNLVIPQKTDSNAKTEEPQSTNRSTKKLYRDADKRLLSGVSSGIAAYFNLDIALVRILFVALAVITSGTFILIYLLMWLIIPKAVTTAQKLEMKGEQVNIETIKNKATSNKDELKDEESQNSTSHTGRKLSNILAKILKVILVTLGAIIALTGVLVIATLLVVLIFFMFQPSTVVDINPEFFSYFNTDSFYKIILLIISLVLIIGCPIFALIYWGVNVNYKNKKATSNTPLWISLVIWILGIITFTATVPETARAMTNGFEHLDSNIHTGVGEFHHNLNRTKVQEQRTVPYFHAIKTQGNIKVKITQQSGEQSLKLTTENANMSNVKTEVEDGTLKIYTTDKHKKQQIIAEIGMDSLSNIKAMGASFIEFENPFTLSQLKVEAEGASKIKLDISMAQKLDFYLAGASRLDLEGTADTLCIRGDGASKIDTKALQAKVLNMELNGASKAKVYTSKSFTGKANGVSSIKVHGNPKTKKIDKSGASKITFKN